MDRCVLSRGRGEKNDFFVCSVCSCFSLFREYHIRSKASVFLVFGESGKRLERAGALGPSSQPCSSRFKLSWCLYSRSGLVFLLPAHAS